jgi:hypothetical protein
MSSSNEKMLVEDGTEQPDMYEELFKGLKEEGLVDPYSDCPPELLPQTEGEVKSAVEDPTQKLRIEGMSWRHLFNRSLKEHPESLRRPASMHASQLSLADMLTCVPSVDRDQFQESVNVPLYIMEKYMLPSLRIQAYVNEKTTEALPGGADTLMAYSFFSQGSVMPNFRTEHDLDVLRNTVFSAEHFIVQQMRTDKEVVEGLSAHLKATIRHLKKETTLQDYDHISDMNQDRLDERQAGIDALIKLYTDQVTRDYNMFRLQKEQLVLLSHLTQRQSIELLEVNHRLSQMIDLNREGLQVSIDEEVLKTSAEMEKRMAAMFEQHRKFVSFATTKLADKITPYDTNDMRKVLESQKEKLRDVLA